MATRQQSKRRAPRKVKKAPTKHSRRGAAKARSNGGAKVAARSNGRAKVAARRQPETLRLRSITPTYTVNDLQKTVSWYCDGLGFIVSERWEEGGTLQGVMLKAGSCTFGLSQDDFAKGRDREKGTGFRLYAETAQSVDALAERIRAYGGKIVSEPADTPWGQRSFTVEDPDGFKISFSQAR